MRANKSLLVVLILLTLTACGRSSSSAVGPAAALSNSPAVQNANSAAKAPDQDATYGPPARLGDLEDPDITESSGIAASRRNADLFWTHNDSGDGPFLYAFDRGGKRAGVWRVTGARAVDWEDMAVGPGPASGRSYVYAGDIGDNSTSRDEIIVYRVAEPQITASDAASTRSDPRKTEPAEVIRLKYPDGKHNAEALLVHPVTGDIYIVTKVSGGAAGVYKAAASVSTSELTTLDRVGEVQLPGRLGNVVTGGDISPDGRRVILCDYVNAYEMALPEKSNGKFDDVWTQPLVTVNIGQRQQGEAICYRLDGRALLTTSEGRPCPLDEIVRR